VPAPLPLPPGFHVGSAAEGTGTVHGMAENDEGYAAQKARAHCGALLNGGHQHTSMLEGKPEAGRPLGPV